MKLSRFNIWVKDYPEKDEYLLFNSRTQALIKVEPVLKDILDKLEGIQEEDLSLVVKGHIAVLKQNGIIVENDKEEDKKLKDFFQQMKYDKDALVFEVTILTTYSCNFKCVYCFEESVKEEVFLDKDTGDSIVRWLKKIAEKKDLNKIFLVYYGGEPLLNIRAIYDISWQMKEWANEFEVDFGFSIITNGSLISEDLIEKLLTVGLKEVRVTVDGDRDAHNKKRPLWDGRPTFDLIMDNIKAMIDKVNVGIVGNFDRENYESISRFLDYLDKEGLLYKLKKIDFAPLSPRLGPKNNPAAIELGECLSFVDKEGLSKEVLAIKRELLSRKLNMKTGLAINACSLIMQDGGITIDPKGAIYKCNALLGYPEFSIGSVEKDIFNEKFEEFLNIDAWNKCQQTCPYIPMCQGGCRFFSYLEHNNFSDLSCKKGYLDNIVPELIKLEYEKLIS